MSFFQYGNLVERTTVTATAGGTTTLVNTSTVVQVFTGSLGQIIVLPDATTFSTTGNSYKIFNQSSSPLTLQFNGGSAFTDAGGTNYSSIPAHSSLAITLQTNGAAAGTWSVLSSNSSSGGGSKNYLTNYTASTSGGNPNVGNGNFELGSTTGFALCHTTLSSFSPSAVGSGGNAFSSSNGGTAASGNLSLSIVSSGQLAGNYSGDLISSAASTAGDMLISSAFYIDRVDQAQMMQGVIYYSAISGTMNFSGTNANTFAVWVYDCTNNLWIQPAGVWNLVQSSGTGKCTFTFQTSSNSTRYQVALININATPGAYSLYVDDFSVGPQITASGPAMSDWVAYTPAIGGVTPSTNTAFWRRVGDSVEVVGKFITSSSSGSNASISLPTGLSLDVTKLSASQTNLLGSLLRAPAGSNNIPGTSSGAFMIVDSTGTSLTNVYIVNGTSSNTFAITSGSGLFSASDVGTYSFKCPVAGWSSNSVMSNDTDTRVVAASYYVSANYAWSSGSVNFDTKLIDTHAAVTASAPGAGAWKFTAPVSGIYVIGGQVGTNTGTSWGVYKNGSFYQSLYAGASAPETFGINQLINLIAGDYIDFRLNSGATVYGGSQANGVAICTISINRLSGPAVITAQSVVAASYYNSVGGVVGNAYKINFDGKLFDTHNAVTVGAPGSYGTWAFTAPVSGLYNVSTVLMALTVGSDIFIYKNNTYYSWLFNTPGGNDVISGSLLIQLNAGDYIDLRPGANTTFSGAASPPYRMLISINRLGGVG